MSAFSDRLYNLLPVLYRLRDADQGQALRALLAIIDGELSGVEADIAGLYDNWFIETSDEWAVPYIGDLLGVRGLNTIQDGAFSQRAYVANTLFYRRRKGTAYVLGILAGDVTGWPAHVVEFFELLQTTQYMNHLRLFNAMPDLRQVNQLNLLGTPFESLPHTADVRHINDRRGRYNIPNVGIFLWRLQAYPLQKVIARQATSPHAYGYHFSPLGNPAPLFNAPASLSSLHFPGGSAEHGGSEGGDEQKVPAPIRPYDFFLDLKAYQEAYASAVNPPEDSRYYGPNRDLQIVKDGAPVPPMQVMCKDLSAWARPPAGKVAVDVRLGRVTFASGEEPTQDLVVYYDYGFSADIGGGPYDRRERITAVQAPIQEFAIGEGQTYPTLADALTAWNLVPKPPAVFRIFDSATYDANLTIDLPAGGMLVIDCENGERPTLVNAAPLKVTSAAANSEETASFTLSGLLIEGSLEMDGRLDLTITDCTLVPGQSLDEDGYPAHSDGASLTVTGADISDNRISIARSILGPLELPEECRGLAVSDSILDAPLAKDADAPSRFALAADGAGTGAGPVTTLERVTVFGEVHVRELSLASEVIFVHPVIADRRQAGCVRFSYVPGGSSVPRRYHCQPDLAVAARKKELDPTPLSASEQERIEMRVRPQFTSVRYGDPAFAQLAPLTSPHFEFQNGGNEGGADEIKTGAEDGSEMGVFSMLQQPQRLKNLQVALEEYLRFGLEAGIFFVT
jgi:hypothetical protein